MSSNLFNDVENPAKVGCPLGQPPGSCWLSQQPKWLNFKRHQLAVVTLLKCLTLKYGTIMSCRLIVIVQNCYVYKSANL